MKQLILSELAKTLVWSVFFVFAEGIVLAIMWAWFVAPLGVPKLMLPQAIGIDLLISLVWYRYAPIPGYENHPEGSRERIVCAVKYLSDSRHSHMGMLLLTLFFGFIVHLFV